MDGNSPREISSSEKLQEERREMQEVTRKRRWSGWRTEIQGEEEEKRERDKITFMLQMDVWVDGVCRASQQFLNKNPP